MFKRIPSRFVSVYTVGFLLQHPQSNCVIGTLGTWAWWNIDPTMTCHRGTEMRLLARWWSENCVFVPPIPTLLLLLLILSWFSAVLFLILDSWNEIFYLNILNLKYCSISYVESFNELTICESFDMKGGIRLVWILKGFYNQNPVDVDSSTYKFLYSTPTLPSLTVGSLLCFCCT